MQQIRLYNSEEEHTPTERQDDDRPRTLFVDKPLEASPFNLQVLLHDSNNDISDGQESLISEDNEEADAVAARQSVTEWRQQHHLQDNRDFALTFSSLEEAHSNAGNIVSMAWAMCHQKFLLKQVGPSHRHPSLPWQIGVRTAMTS